MLFPLIKAMKWGNRAAATREAWAKCCFPLCPVKSSNMNNPLRKGRARRAPLLPCPSPRDSQIDADALEAEWTETGSQGQWPFILGFLVQPQLITDPNTCSGKQWDAGYSCHLWGTTSWPFTCWLCDSELVMWLLCASVPHLKIEKYLPHRLLWRD